MDSRRLKTFLSFVSDRLSPGNLFPMILASHFRGDVCFTLMAPSSTLQRFTTHRIAVPELLRQSHPAQQVEVAGAGMQVVPKRIGARPSWQNAVDNSFLEVQRLGLCHQDPHKQPSPNKYQRRDAGKVIEQFNSIVARKGDYAQAISEHEKM